MNTKNTSIGILIISYLFVGIASVSTAEAAESNSFRLYTGSLADAEAGAKDSPSFKVNEDRMTWRAFPLTGTNFKVVTAPPTVVSSSSSSSSEEGGSSGGDSESSSGGGGRRTIPVITPPADVPDSTPKPPKRPAAPGEPEPEKPIPPIFTGEIDLELPVPISSVFEAVSYPRGERLIDKMHYFYLTDDYKTAAPERLVWPTLCQEYISSTQGYSLFVLSFSLISIFLGFLILVQRGFALNSFVSLSKLRKRLLLVPFFILHHRKEKLRFIIRELYPNVVRKKHFRSHIRS